ncbi:hypothetical protein H2200_012187 [Cladophialophora chaetospira]|uniref:Uncharacterized protein n=1 Tax=Cladophialophora chaetospira TaxID=386627 RepID=A0AA39CCN2_9EURO|nr:hypothetical protein H2200_012187 [Cladophialophora chaetospira]
MNTSESEPLPLKKPVKQVGSKSLQDIAAAKAVSALQEDEDAVRTWNFLDASTQQILFPYLWKEQRRLLDQERRCKVYIERRDYFRSRWEYRTYADDERYPRERAEALRTCSSANLIIPVSGGGKAFELCHCWDSALLTRCSKCGIDLDKFTSRDVLRTRIIAAFGTPPEQREESWEGDPLSTDCVWGIELRERHFGHTYFIFGENFWPEYEGEEAHEFGFDGAMDLLNWLVNEEPPEPFVPYIK